MKPSAVFEFQVEGQETAFYLLNGSIEIDGQQFSSPTLVVFHLGTKVRIQARTTSVGMILGGEPLPERRFIHWNFVASKPELIERAKARWRAQEFAKVPGETEFVPLPEEH